MHLGYQELISLDDVGSVPCAEAVATSAISNGGDAPEDKITACLCYVYAMFMIYLCCIYVIFMLFLCYGYGVFALSLYYAYAMFLLC